MFRIDSEKLKKVPVETAVGQQESKLPIQVELTKQISFKNN